MRYRCRSARLRAQQNQERRSDPAQRELALRRHGNRHDVIMPGGGRHAPKVIDEPTTSAVRQQDTVENLFGSDDEFRTGPATTDPSDSEVA